MNKQAFFFSKDSLKNILEWARKGLKWIDWLKYKYPIETLIGVKFLNKLIDRIAEDFDIKLASVKTAEYNEFKSEMRTIQHELNKISAVVEQKIYNSPLLQARLRTLASRSTTKMPISRMNKKAFYQPTLVKKAYVCKNEGSLWIMDEEAGTINRIFDPNEIVGVEG